MCYIALVSFGKDSFAIEIKLFSDIAKAMTEQWSEEKKYDAI